MLQRAQGGHAAGVDRRRQRLDDCLNHRVLFGCHAKSLDLQQGHQQVSVVVVVVMVWGWTYRLCGTPSGAQLAQHAQHRQRHFVGLVAPLLFCSVCREGRHYCSRLALQLLNCLFMYVSLRLVTALSAVASCG